MSSKAYNDNTMIRPDVIEGETDWVWNKEDSGAWDGPKMDWETSHREKYLKYIHEPKVVVTAGANQGLYSRLYSNIFETVYAFEPDPMSFHCLVNNCQKPNVIKMNCALGFDAQQVAMVEVCAQNTGQHRVGSTGIIPVLPLDAFHFPRVDLLQLDVEGYEHSVILGARETIIDCQPVVIMENGRTTEIQQFMTDLGYTYMENSVSDAIYIVKGHHKEE